MNVDRTPDDPVPAAETDRLTDSPQRDAPRPTPEPEHSSPPEQRQPPDREREPERESHDEQQEPESERRPESPTPPNDPDAPAPTDSPSRPTGNTPDTPDTAEPRSRQEHAAPTDTAEQGSESLQGESSPEKDTAELEYKARSDDSADEHQPSDQVPPESAESSKDADRPSGTGPSDEAIRPLTDQEYAEHVTEVRDRLVEAHEQGLSSDHQYTIDKKREIWSEKRQLQQDSIIEDVYQRAEAVPCEKKCIIAGGLGGAGKSTVLAEYAEIDRSQYLTINPDDMKEEMARRGMVPEVDGLSPMEASDLVHEESSYLARQLSLRAQADGKNIIWDITMSSTKTTTARVADLRSAGYTQVEGLFVDIPLETSIKRTESRHREGHDSFRAGISLGGRLVPPEIIRRQADEDWGSKNRRTFELMKDRFDKWSVYDNSVEGRAPRLLESTSPTTRSKEVQEKRLI